MGIEKGIFKRMELLVGEQVMQRTADARVIIFGVGGVGAGALRASSAQEYVISPSLIPTVFVLRT